MLSAVLFIHVWSDSQAVIVYTETRGPDGLNNNNNIHSDSLGPKGSQSQKGRLKQRV